MIINRTKAIRISIGIVGIINGLFAIVLAIFGVALLTKTGSILGQTKSREEFASAMFMGIPGFVIIIIAIIVGALALGCWFVYRHVSLTSKLGFLTILFALIAPLPLLLLGILAFAYF